MAEEIGSAYLTILPSLKDFPGSLRSGIAPAIAAQSREDGSTYGHGFAGALATTLKYSAAYGAIRLVGQAMTTAGRAIFGFNSQLEANQIAFTTMLQSATKARVFMASLIQFAKTTPFDVPGVVQASQQLLAYGFAAKDVLPALTAIGDAAAGLGGGADTLAHITLAVGQIAAKGRVQAQELLQLTNAGVPAIRILANEFHVSTFEMQQAVTKGLVPASKAIPALLSGLETGTKGAAGATAKFGGLMVKQSKTFLGALSNIRDGLNVWMSTAFKPVFKVGEGVLNHFANVLSTSRASNAAKSFAAGMRTVIAGVSGVAALLIRGDFTHNLAKAFGVAEDSPVIAGILNVRTKFISAFDAVRTYVTGTLIPALQAAWPQVQAAIGQVAQFVTADLIPAFVSIFNILQPLAAQALRTFGPGGSFDLIRGTAAVIGAAGAVLLNVLGPAVRNVFGFLEKHGVAVRAILVGVLGVFAAYKVSMLAMAAAQRIAAIAAAAFRVVMIGVDLVLDANPISLIILALAGLAAGFAYAYTHSNTFRHAVQTAFHAIEVAGGNMAGFIIKFVIRPIIEGFLLFAKGVLGSAAAAFGWVPGLGPKLKGAYRTVSSFATTTENTLNQWANDMYALGENAGLSFTQGLTQAIAAGGQVALSTAAGVANKVAVMMNAAVNTAQHGSAATTKSLKAPGKAKIPKISVPAVPKIKVPSFSAADIAGPDKAKKGAGGAGASAAASQSIKNTAKFMADLSKLVVNGLVAGIHGSSALLVKEVGTTLDKLRSAAKEKLPGNLHAAVEQSLGLETTFNKRLQQVYKTRGQIANKLKSAQDKLNGIRSTYLQFVQQVTQQLNGSTLSNALNAATSTSGSPISFSHALQAQEATARAFLTAIRQLKAAGLSTALIEQIISAGPDAGLQIASELLLEGSTGIANANRVQSQLTSLGKSIGSFGADQLYKAGQQTAQGIVDGLRSQEKALDAQMDRMATRMVSSIKHALGIHSPSTVFRDEVGVMIGRGTAEGILASRKHVTAATTGLVNVPGTRGVAPVAVGVGGGLTVHQDIVTADPMAAARESIRLQNRAVRRALPVGV